MMHESLDDTLFHKLEFLGNKQTIQDLQSFMYTLRAGLTDIDKEQK